MCTKGKSGKKEKNPIWGLLLEKSKSEVEACFCLNNNEREKYSYSSNQRLTRQKTSHTKKKRIISKLFNN